jgi:hypothetical protein
VDPSWKGSENVLERLCAVELAFGSYSVCPEQLESQLDEGKKISLLPVSKSTVSCQGSVGGLKSSYKKLIPVKDTGGVPTEMVPNHNVGKVGYFQKEDVVHQYSSCMWQIHLGFSCQ